MVELFINGLIAHLIADWLLQNEWMAINKVKVGHPAGIFHAWVHGLLFLNFFPPLIALVLAIAHYLIDLRFALVWWRETFEQTTEGVFAPHVAIWQDQVVHIVCVWFAALLAQV
jgi:hypothetical protein